MKTPIACTIIRNKVDSEGFLIKNDRDDFVVEQVPGYILSIRNIGTENATLFYEVVDMTGVVTLVPSDCVIYEMTDIHERFRKLKQ